jgi:GAF domain-containing protein/HAMP domain-containing protein
MQTQETQKTNTGETQTQRAFWISIGTGVVMLLILAFFLITNSGMELKGWRDVRIFVAALSLSGFISAWLVRQGKAILGVSLILAMLYISVVLTALSIANVGIAIATVTIALTFSITSAVFPRRLANRMSIAVLFLAAAIVSLDIFQPFERIPNDTPGITWGLAIFLVLIYGVFIFRQFASYTLRTKLIVAFLVAALIPLVAIAFLNDRSTRIALTNDANKALLSAASLTAAQLDTFITNNLDTIRTQASLPSFSTYLSLPASQRTDGNGEIIKILSTFARQNPIYISSIALYDLKGITQMDTFSDDMGTDKSDRDYIQKAIETGLPYASNVEFSQTTGDASLYFSAPVRNAAGEIIGVIRTRYNAAILQDFIYANNGLVGTSSYPLLIDNNYVRLAHGNEPALIFKTLTQLDAATVSELQKQRRLPPGSPAELGTNLVDYQASLENVDTQPFFAGTLVSGANQQAATVRTKTQPWMVTFVQAQNEFLAPINTQARSNIILTIVASLAVSLFGLFLAQTLSGPITRLTQTAEKIAGGDINIQAQVETGDEIGTLAGAFNRMTQQLRDFITTLEARVAERTRNLELAGEVGRTVSQVRALDVMLKDAAELIREQFDLYYVQVYLTDPSQTNLILQSGTGSVGVELVTRSHRLPLNTASINGRAAIEKKSVVISDTAASPAFKPNPLLPNTRSEMAVPLLIGEKVVGVLDMQSEVRNSLNQEMLSAFEALAGQLAIAIQNANFLAETEQARAEVEAQARRLSRANWADYLDAIHKPEEIGFVFEQNKVSTLKQEEKEKDDALISPISVSGASLGNLVVELAGESPIARADELINTVARQVAQQIENLRLLESAERFRFEAETASRRLTHEGWKDYMDTASEDLSYIYDLREVRPIRRGGEQQTEEATLNLPIKVRDEIIGKLIVQGIEADDSTSLEIANAIAERLGAHIEGLRLSNQTEQALMSTKKLAEREQALRQITSAVRGSTDPATILRSAARELGTILGRKTIVRLATANQLESSEPDHKNDVFTDSQEA